MVVVSNLETTCQLGQFFYFILFQKWNGSSVNLPKNGCLFSNCGVWTLYLFFLISNYPSEVPSYQWDPNLKSHLSQSVAVKKDLTVKTELSGDSI